MVNAVCFLLIYLIYYQWTYTGNITDISNILPVDT